MLHDMLSLLKDSWQLRCHSTWRTPMGLNLARPRKFLPATTVDSKVPVYRCPAASTSWTQRQPNTAVAALCVEAERQDDILDTQHDLTSWSIWDATSQGGQPRRRACEFAGNKNVTRRYFLQRVLRTLKGLATRQLLPRFLLRPCCRHASVKRRAKPVVFFSAHPVSHYKSLTGQGCEHTPVFRAHDHAFAEPHLSSPNAAHLKNGVSTIEPADQQRL